MAQAGSMRRLTAGHVGKPAGVAVAPDRLLAVCGSASAEVPVPGGVRAASPETLTAAFRALHERLASAAPRGVRLVLLPPLVDVRLVELPPLRRQEAEAVLRRDPRRYFLNGGELRVVGVGERPRGAGGPVLAAAASVALVDGLRTAATAAGWRVDRVAAAHGAWLAAARAAGAERAVIGLADMLYVVGGTADRITTLRRLPPGALEELAAPRPDRGLVLADDAEIRRALGAALPGSAAGADGSDPARAAARHAHRAAPELLTPGHALALRAGARARAALLAAAAILLVIGAAALELWGAERELDAVRQRRAALRAAVAPLLVLRDSMDALAERTAAVGALATAVPAWTPALLDLALLLPEDAHVEGLRTAGDTLVADVVAGRAGAALQALRSAASLRDVRLRGVVDREMSQGSTARERFTLTARVVPPVSTRVAPAGAGGRP